mgnify:CR=1 FL=1
MIANRRKLYGIRLCLLLLAGSLLTGCTANVSSTDENGLSPHLTVDLQLPEQIEVNQSALFTILVHENGDPYEGADRVEFEIWPVDQRQDSVRLPGNPTASGTYTVSTSLAEEGVYTIRCHVISEQYHVMPTKQFAIGEAAVHQLLLQEQAQSEITTADSHHH